eukprot:Mycagemm_TRINITY_DN10273_c0_g4::TRINITY_DN10273_c0_g4_i1::g.4189::m.4189 type:complete len:106 gc:universal TRINITY_DN10273_c0_g4_i1:1064-1381(+)
MRRAASATPIPRWAVILFSVKPSGIEVSFWGWLRKVLCGADRPCRLMRSPGRGSRTPWRPAPGRAGRCVSAAIAGMMASWLRSPGQSVVARFCGPGAVTDPRTLR